METSVWQQLQEAGRYMLNHGLAWGNAGNISARTHGDHYLITASGTDLGELDENDFVECSLSAGATSSVAGKKPSKEVPMHQAIYESRPDVGAVLHASPFYSTMLACSGERLPSEWFVETMYYLERIERVPYYHPGSRELGDAVREKARKANVLFLENHGVLVYDTNVKEARMAMHTLEMACKMFVTAKSSGITLRALPEDVVQSFLNESGYRPRRGYSE
ncbi:3-oxo-tetronate 4-phosphate decarboxylase [Paenibacillus allorhizoplanae]|uniref:3-oxo-tetronate 4-phosphate decarboxylase n=1 Tax=Paenibacillus allorhizoplanae TaxID=2905648 RepID=A0ABN8FUD6_9BACL|nr:class II aldolase/adducin family protein [Paenibacillus allorhizoplanae]CAH1192499.1 3-oxo-tetronate 4-phosphate decarboxylase [Paenibacillus allorhizoplanae]